MITQRDVGFELKQLDDAAGTFHGLAAVFDVLDEQRDRIAKGAFAKTLAEHGSVRPLFWQHDVNQPLGFAGVRETDEGLWVTGRLNLEIRKAAEVRSLIRQAKAAGLPFGLSIGYETKQSTWQGNTRLITEIRLWEVSPTIFPAQPLAVVAGVKSMAGDCDEVDLEQFRADLRDARAWAEERLKAMTTLSPEAAFAFATRGPDDRRALALQLSAGAAATREPREILQRFLADCDRLEAVAVMAHRSRATQEEHASGPVRLETKSRTPGGVAARLGCPPDCPHCEE